MRQRDPILPRHYRQRLDELRLVVTRLWPDPVHALSDSWERFDSARSFIFMVWATIALSVLSSLPAPVHNQDPSVSESFASPVASTINASASIEAVAPGVETYGPSPQVALALSPARAERLRECWGASCMRVDEALALTPTLRNVVVAILDTGIDEEGALLSDCIIEHLSVVDSAQTGDMLGHGTHIASTVAAIAPNCTIIDVKVTNDRGKCASTDVAKGVLAVIGRHADVINLSLEVEPSPALEEAIHQAWLRGSVVVAAAGMPQQIRTTIRVSDDCATPTERVSALPAMGAPVYPAAYSDAIAVTGTSEEDELAPLCNRGVWVDVAAPGHKTFADLPGGTQGLLTGSSTACAHVSGLAALLCGVATDISGNGTVNDEVRTAITATARHIDIEGTGSGIVDAAAAVRFLQTQTG